ncbi:MAG: ATPase [Sulfolobaceae archaeon]
MDSEKYYNLLRERLEKKKMEILSQIQKEYEKLLENRIKSIENIKVNILRESMK